MSEPDKPLSESDEKRRELLLAAAQQIELVPKLVATDDKDRFVTSLAMFIVQTGKLQGLLPSELAERVNLLKGPESADWFNLAGTALGLDGWETTQWLFPGHRPPEYEGLVRDAKDAEARAVAVAKYLRFKAADQVSA